MSRVSEKPYFVYVLWSQRGQRFYVGLIENPERRLQQHNQALRGWTARFRPWSLIYSRRYSNYTAARQQEIELKSQKAGRGFFRLTGLDPTSFRARPPDAGS